jgi:hypothetical protein
MIATMNHWIKYLRFILGGFTLGTLLATVQGHVLNDNKPFPRPVAAVLTVLFVGSSLISHTIAERKVGMFDRVALVCFLVAFLGGLFKNTPRAGLIGLGIGFCCLFAAWLHNRLSSIPDRDAGVTARHL